MTLKQNCRRPLPHWLAQLNPATLSPSDFVLRNVLEHSLYYPAAGFDGRPVQFLGGFIHSFIHVDYGHDEASLTAEIQRSGFRGYHVAASTNLDQHHLTPNGWVPQIPHQYQEQGRRFTNMQALGFVRKPFARWYIFDRNDDMNEDHGPKRFSFIHLCADGISAYQALYWPNNSAPEVLAIIRPGTGFGGNYTDFRDPAGFFAWTVLRGCHGHHPDYLVCEDVQSFWPAAYPTHVEWFHPQIRIGVWRR